MHCDRIQMTNCLPSMPYADDDIDIIAARAVLQELGDEVDGVFLDVHEVNVLHKGAPVLELAEHEEYSESPESTPVFGLSL